MRYPHLPASGHCRSRRYASARRAAHLLILGIGHDEPFEAVTRFAHVAVLQVRLRASKSLHARQDALLTKYCDDLIAAM